MSQPPKSKRFITNIKAATFPSETSTSLAAASAVPPVAIRSSIIITESFSDIESLCSQGFPDSSSDNPSGWEGTTEDCKLKSGLSYGFGLHYILVDKFGIGARYVSQPLELTSYEGHFGYEDMERINLYLSYQF